MNKQWVNHMLLLLLLTIVIRLRERDTSDVWDGLSVKALFLVPQKRQLLYAVEAEGRSNGGSNPQLRLHMYHIMHVQ